MHKESRSLASIFNRKREENTMLNKNLVYQTANDQLHAADRADANMIMDKIYTNPVFQEFMKQWGEASYRIEHKKQSDSDQN